MESEVSRFRKFIFSLKIFTLEGSFELLLNYFHESARFRTRIISHFLFLIYLIHTTIFCFRFLFAYYCLTSGRDEVLFRLDPFMYVLSVSVFFRQPFMLFVFIGLLCHNINGTIYQFRFLFQDFIHEAKQLFQLDHLFETEGLTLWDALFRIRSLKNLKNRFFRLSYTSGLNLNPFLKPVDYRKLFLSVHLLKLSFISITSAITLSLVIGFPRRYLFFLSVLNTSGLLSHIALFIDTALLFVRPILGEWCPLILIYSIYFAYRTIQLPYQRFRVRIDHFRSVISRKCVGDQKTIRMLRQLRYGRHIFTCLISKLDHMNRKCVSSAFTTSIIFLFMGNITINVVLVLGRVSQSVKYYLIYIVIFQVIFNTCFVTFLIIYCDTLYSPAPAYLWLYVTLSNRRNRKLLMGEMVSLALFLETIRPYRKWCFKLGMIGKITRFNFAAFPFFYSSLVIQILPLISR